MSYSFKQHYDSDPEFRERHLNYVKTRVDCECGGSYIRCGSSKHRNTLKHKDALQRQDEQKNKDLLGRENLQNQINDLLLKVNILLEKNN